MVLGDGMSEREIARMFRENDQLHITARINELVKNNPNMGEKEAAIEKGLIILQYYSTIPADELNGLSTREKYEKIRDNYYERGNTDEDMMDIIRGFNK